MTVKVLIVDDEAPMRRLISRTLAGRGYECHAVEGAEGARRSLANAKVDLLISDIRMPGESGIDLIRTVTLQYPQVAILMLSGTGDNDVIDAVIAIGVDGYITKPFEKSQLLVGAELALSHRNLTLDDRQRNEKLERQVAERTRELEQTISDMETARRESQKKTALFEALFNNAMVGITICKPTADGNDYRIVDYNPAAERLDGKSRESVLQRSIRDVFPQAEAIGLLGWAQEVSQTGRSLKRLVALPIKDETHWRLYSFYRLPNGEVVVFYSDETKHIQAERRLHDQVKFIQNLMESIPSPLFYKDTEGRYQGCNSAFAAMLGVSRETIIGKKVEDLAPEDLVQRYKAVDRKLLAHEGIRQIETQVMIADGTRRDIILSKHSYTDGQGNIAGVVGVLVDISERKQAENTLKESEGEFRAIAESAQDAIIKIDDQGAVTYWNRAAEAIFGFTAEEAIGRRLHDLIAPGRYQDQIRKAFAHFTRTGRGDATGKLLEVTACTKSGHEFPAELSIAGVHLKGAWHAIGIVRDITERKQMEERLLRKHRDLKVIKADLEDQNRKLMEMHAELQRAQQQTVQQEKMASIGQLAAGVAHEINNPTGFVSSNLKSLQDYLDDIFRLLQVYRELCLQLEASPAVEAEGIAIQEKLGEINRIKSDIDLEFLVSDIADLIRESREGTERIKKIVIDLKDFAHPGQHERTTADINRNLESVLNIVWNELKYKATVQKDLGDLPPVECYPQQLNQVFMNLLVNAGHAMDTMGEIHIATRTAGDHIEIAIRDTGCGIPEENLKRIFDPFFTTKPVGKGTGLGLNVAYNVIKKHGGEIKAASQVGQGTTFTIRLPIELPEKAVPSADRPNDDTGEPYVRQAS